MGRIDTIHLAILRLYQAALSSEQWPLALATLTKAVGAHRALLVGEPAGIRSLVVADGIGDRVADRVHRDLMERRPAWIDAIQVGAAQKQSACISDFDFQRSTLYQEAVRPTGAFYGLLAPLSRLPGQQAIWVAGRLLGAPDFTEEDIEAAALIVPHLQTALAVRSRVQAADYDTKRAYDTYAELQIGVILLDATLRPTYVNKHAELLANLQDGLVITRDGIAASRPHDTAQLNATIATVALLQSSSRAGGTEVLRPGHRLRCHLSRRPPNPPLTVIVVPFDSLAPSRPSAARVMLIVTEPANPHGGATDLLGEPYQLTQREADLTALLVGGLSLSEAAGRLGIQKETARAYLKRIFAKTGTHRQAELVAVLSQKAAQA